MAKRKSRWPRRLLILVILAALGSGSWYYWQYKNRKKPIVVQSEKVARRDITESVVATGQIHAVTKVVINPEVAGEIIELPVKEGQEVKEGDLLVRIKQDNYLATRDSAQASYLSSLSNLKLSQANLDKANKDFERTESLYQDKLISDAEYQNGKTALQVAKASFEVAEHGVDQAKAALQRTEEDLAKTVITAPIDGTVTLLRSEKGERVVGTSLMSGTEIMTIAQLDAMEARVEVGEVDVVLIKVGQKARIEADAFRSQEFTGTVTEIANASTTAAASQGAMGASSQSATKFQVKIRVNEKEAFRPGMSVTANIETRSVSQVLSVPIQCVTTRAPKTKDQDKPDKNAADLVAPPTKRPGAKEPIKRVEEVVFLVDGTHAKMVPVKSGISDDDYVEITEGLEEGQDVITGSYRAISRDLEAGSEIQLGDEKAPAPPKP